ncbi:MAG: type II toxin-antitoxin system HicA family toxin [Planctomycetota bacterium]
MSELPAITGREAIRAFESLGFAVERVHGSHHILRKPGFRYVLTVPVHGSTALKPGLLNGLIRTAGISRDEFLAALRR